MEYFLLFLEGILTFISPCLLPMLPIYVAYFSGGNQKGRSETFKNALGFVLGFTFVFIMLGAFAGIFGRFFKTNQVLINIFTGSVVLLFGFNYLEIFKLSFLNR